MAQRRMFSPQIIDSDAFLDMPSSAQSLYFHLGMRADDDGFVGNPKKILRMIGSGEDDFKILLAKRFILIFESGVIVIKHWRINNLIRKDWYRETIYKEEKNKIAIKDNGAYTELGNESSTKLIHSIGKDRLGKDRLDYNNIFKTPKIEEIENYCLERKNKINPNQFFDFYESKGWMIGKNKMKNWKAAIRTWEQKTIQANSRKISEL